MNRYSQYSEISLLASVITLSIAILTSFHFLQFYGKFPGYALDASYYYYVLNQYVKNSSIVTFPDYINWFNLIYGPGLFLLGTILHNIAGLSSLQILNYIFPLFLSLLSIGIYIIVKQLTNNRFFATIAAPYIVLSPTQIRVIEWNFYKTPHGEFLLLISIAIALKYLKILENQNTHNIKLILLLPLIFSITLITHRPYSFYVCMVL